MIMVARDRKPVLFCPGLVQVIYRCESCGTQTARAMKDKWAEAFLLLGRPSLRTPPMQYVLTAAFLPAVVAGSFVAVILGGYGIARLIALAL